MAKKKEDELKKVLKPDVAVSLAQKDNVKKVEAILPEEKKAGKIEKTENATVESQQGQQYYVLPENQVSAQKDFGFGIAVNASAPSQNQSAAVKRKLRGRENSKASGIVGYILLVVGALFAAFGVYLKIVLFTDTASTIFFTIFGFGILVYGLLFAGIILQVISFILAFVQIGNNRRAFSIVTVCILPLLNLAALAVEAYFLMSSVAA